MRRELYTLVLSEVEGNPDLSTKDHFFNCMTENPFLKLKDVTVVGCCFLKNDFSRLLNEVILHEDPNDMRNRISGQAHSELRELIRYKLFAEIGDEDLLDETINLDRRARNNHWINTKK